MTTTMIQIQDTVILSLGAGRLYGESAPTCNVSSPYPPFGAFSASSRVRWTGGSRRSAPHRLCIRLGVADTSCHSSTGGTVGSGPIAVAALHLGSPWRSPAECFRASSLGFDMARCRRDPARTGHRAHRFRLARRDHSQTGRRPLR
jgi:hypothetical protein